MMSSSSHQTLRLLSSIAATFIALASGTNYVYSAWGPQFADKLHLTTTQSNLIGSFGNFGMYAIAIPLGMLIDAKGPKLSIWIGVATLALGYFPLHEAYDRGAAPMPVLCILSGMTGLGSCAAFNAAIKASALNWPHHRGKATGFPLAAFGLSAFFFSSLGQLLVPDSTGNFLMFLACGTSGITLVASLFLRIYPHDECAPLDENRLHRSKSNEHKHRAQQRYQRLGTSTFERTKADSEASIPNQVEATGAESSPISADTEASSLLTQSSDSCEPPEEGEVIKDRAHRVDIRGFQMLRSVEFWQLFAILCIMSGIGLMTINNIGHSAGALWLHFDSTKTKGYRMRQQALHVSALSLGSFSGRLASGIASDFLVRDLQANRAWCLAACCVVSFAGQMLGFRVGNPHSLLAVSSLNGIAYGLLFGCFPSITAETFGVHGLATNWGFMTLASAIGGNIFNLYYGKVFDAHSTVQENGDRQCLEGLACYQSAYGLTIWASLVGFVVILWTIRHQQQVRAKEELDKQAVE